MASAYFRQFAIDHGLTVDYGYDVVEVAKQVQNKVKAAIENMTGLTVSGVNVKIAGVNIENGK